MMLAVTIVNACLRDGRGGSPTAVMADDDFSDAERSRIPAMFGTSHAVFVDVLDADTLGMRFFTSAGELPACGHGTIAALAFTSAADVGMNREVLLRTGARRFSGKVVNRRGICEVMFEPGGIELREAYETERELALGVLGPRAGVLVPKVSVASIGRARLLVPVASRAALAALLPDLDRLRAGCDQLGLLGCYVYSAAGSDGRCAARMFAPGIGVSEDIANANSTACLVARLARDGTRNITVDMGDSVGQPASIVATADTECEQLRVLVGGQARISTTHRISEAVLRLGAE
jgi:PhzF family phenazine biosynthesis protein